MIKEKTDLTIEMEGVKRELKEAKTEKEGVEREKEALSLQASFSDERGNAQEEEMKEVCKKKNYLILDMSSFYSLFVVLTCEFLYLPCKYC